VEESFIRAFKYQRRPVCENVVRLLRSILGRKGFCIGNKDLPAWPIAQQHKIGQVLFIIEAVVSSKRTGNPIGYPALSRVGIEDVAQVQVLLRPRIITASIHLCIGPFVTILRSYRF
jgi:hypothetical protein